MNHAQGMIALATGAGLALAGSAHCVLMCGPVSVAVRARGGRRATLAYGFGRSVSYALMGLMAGSFGKLLVEATAKRWVALVLSWLLGAALVISALRLVGVPARASVVPLGRAPRANRVGRWMARLVEQPTALGAFTALLPCGMLYSALLVSAALADPWAAALSMASFALLSGGALAGVAELAGLFTLRERGRRVLAAVLVGGALVAFLRPLVLVSASGEPACHTVGAH